MIPRGRLLAWAMALRSHARRVSSGMFHGHQLAEDLVHLALEAETLAREIPPEPAQIPDDGPNEEDAFDAADTVPLGPILKDKG